MAAGCRFMVAQGGLQPPPPRQPLAASPARPRWLPALAMVYAAQMAPKERCWPGAELPGSGAGLCCEASPTREGMRAS